MKNELQQSILDAAKDASLIIHEVTYGMNYYPSQLGDYFISGFDNLEQANEFITENGGELAYAETRGGQQFVMIKGKGFINKEFTSDNFINDMGDDYNEFCEDEDSIIDVIKSLDSIDEMEAMIKSFKELKAKQDEAGADYCVVTCSSGYFDTIPRKTMQYRADVTTNFIGVFVEKQ